MLGSALLVAGMTIAGTQAVAAHMDPTRGGSIVTDPGTWYPSQATANANARYVEYVYRDLFGRKPDDGDLASWTTALDAGESRTTIVNAMTSRSDYRERLIRATYSHYLGRLPDSDGVRAWLDAMDSGSTVPQLESGLLASTEYFIQAGSTATGWATRLNQDVLGRRPDANETAEWTASLGHGSTRRSVAMELLLSTDHLTTVVDGYYRDLLHRDIDPTGQLTWTTALQVGERDETVVSGILASDEYWSHATSPTYLRLSTPLGTIDPGESQTYTVEGFGPMGTSFGDVTALAAFTVDGDTSGCVGATCTAVTAGDHIVSATVGHATGTGFLRMSGAAAAPTQPHGQIIAGGHDRSAGL